MNDRTRIGIAVLLAALALGALGMALLQPVPLGLNLVVWSFALFAAIGFLCKRLRVPLDGGGRWMALPALAFTAGIAWTSSPFLQAMDVFAAVVAIAVFAMRGKAGQAKVVGVLAFATDTLVTGLYAIAGMLFLTVSHIQWPQIPRSNTVKHMGSILRGLVIVLPLLLIFGGLFMAADAVFEHLVQKIFRIPLDSIVQDGFYFFWSGWVAGGLITAVFLRDPAKEAEEDRFPKVALGPIEVGMVLGLLDILFLAFVMVQISYFFGGQRHVIETAGLTSANYARRGFFELVTVGALALPVLLILHWLLRSASSGGQRLFQILAGTQVVLLFVIMASAINRMRLYQVGYGLSEERVYATAFMGWLAIVFLWFSITVLRGHRDRFALGALVSGFAVLTILNFTNPDALIVRNNVTNIRPGRVLDVPYLVQLGADAVPALVEALPRLAPADRAQAARGLLDRWEGVRNPDWRTWNRGRSRAWRTVHEHRDALRRVSGL